MTEAWQADLAEAVGMHESTITRVVSACTFQNLHGVFAIAGVVRAKRASRKRR
jgi:DNA-directed RNA polymerase specialized sigma54-like protein